MTTSTVSRESRPKSLTMLADGVTVREAVRASTWKGLFLGESISRRRAVEGRSRSYYSSFCVGAVGSGPNLATC